MDALDALHLRLRERRPRLEGSVHEDPTAARIEGDVSETTTAPRPRMPAGLAFVVPTLLLGMLVAAQWQTQSTRPPSPRYQLTLAEAALDLQSEQDRLKA